VGVFGHSTVIWRALNRYDDESIKVSGKSYKAARTWRSNKFGPPVIWSIEILNQTVKALKFTMGIRYSFDTSRFSPVFIKLSTVRDYQYP
jgi:hypothetical protein